MFFMQPRFVGIKSRNSSMQGPICVKESVWKSKLLFTSSYALNALPPLILKLIIIIMMISSSDEEAKYDKGYVNTQVQDNIVEDDEGENL